MKTLMMTVAAITLLLLAAGCARQSPLVDRFYGTSYELAKQSQIHNPAAGIDSGPPQGLSGGVATRVIERYESGFEKPAAKTESYTVTVEGVEID